MKRPEEARENMKSFVELRGETNIYYKTVAEIAKGILEVEEDYCWSK